MNLVFVINEKNEYARHLGVVMSSILNNTNEFCKFWILYDNLSSESMIKLEKISKKNNSEINFIKINREKIKSLPIDERSYIDLVTYARLLAPEILKDEDKALYLDCDLVVLKDIKELYGLEFNGKSLVAVTDGERDQNRGKKRLDLKEEDSYFNAGVLLMNLEKLRENNKFQKAVEFAATTDKVLELNDQDALNAVLYDDFREGGKSWNYTHGNSEELRLKKSEVGIIHYTGSIKPWDARCINKYRREYLRYLKLTPWEGYPLDNQSLFNSLMREVTMLKLYSRSFRHSIKKMLKR
ncbi:general stress protein A [Propionigenium maris DSM 9537]|uniref:General stress protein A n=1 Tax=Propionigenium maris DSM 9537 TaxID=1123000 RepID=A0A9W6GH59_9FUSO|nr:glycosyltransferase family 8 protein [Propionigenium maris]GLI55163.1 general stress protein A [Propionigenium maris DSM 9537]